ncbi:hypothetical protein PENANT_c010G00944 [Penicillium antarcticum]|uniref:Hydrophobin n=1 Tax=Penicillium antarcticum TaxID=416450 RepID=A0A1V6Q7Z7_9EURO|nr:uncharacterized protein N7508_000567 [Penicillium antarcticum]KAJ5320284.1 hypothetical protein N7508_000567 [Penicillium antarcticum]OQD85345.1 hypothetical protein PENANT_c010G00944 [Penicillium antarcticum]
MQMTSFTAILALAMSVAAVAPVAEKTNMGLSHSAALGGAKEQCTSGDLACCDSKETISGDGILGNLLAKGALNGLLGNDDAACAKTSALDDLNVLAQTKDTNEGPSCKNIIACCPEGSGKCTAIDS